MIVMSLSLPTRAWAAPTAYGAAVRNDRRRLIERARPFLQPDEAVAHVVRAMEGPNRWLALGLAVIVGFGLSVLLRVAILAVPVFWLAFTRMYARRLILATDQGLVVLAGGRFRFTPSRLLDRLPLDTPIGPLRGLWLETRLNGRRMFVVPRSVRSVADADADLAS